MIKACFAAILLLVCSHTNAQLGTTPILGAKSLSMGNTGAAAEGIQSIYFGQAGLSSIDKFAVELSTEQRFTLSDLSLASAALGLRVGKFGVAGLFISNYGLDVYREQKIGLSFAKLLSENISIGAQWSLNTIRIDEYGSTSFIGINIGVIGHISKKISAGIHISNPMKRVILIDETTTQLINMGLKYTLSEKVYLISDYRLLSNYNNSFHFGVDYKIIEPLNLRIGIDTGASSFHFGMAYNLNKKAAVHGGFTNHQYLGITPALSLSYAK